MVDKIPRNSSSSLFISTPFFIVQCRRYMKLMIITTKQAYEHGRRQQTFSQLKIERKYPYYILFVPSYGYTFILTCYFMGTQTHLF